LYVSLCGYWSDVRYWHLADIDLCAAHVCSNQDMPFVQRLRPRCPLRPAVLLVTVINSNVLGGNRVPI
jgi:hypothetical protein